MSQFKPSEYTEFETQEVNYRQANTLRSRFLESARMGLTIVAFLIGVTILSTSADALAVFNNTHLTQDFLLPIWPDNFNLRPTVSIVIGGAIITFANTISLLASKIPALRNKTTLHAALSVLAPVVGLTAAIISTAFFYIVNHSDVVDSLQSWSCRWAGVGMNSQPHFGTLCSESKVSLYLSILMIPLETIILAVAAWGVVAEKKTVVMMDRKGSPALS